MRRKTADEITRYIGYEITRLEVQISSGFFFGDEKAEMKQIIKTLQNLLEWIKQ